MTLTPGGVGLLGISAAVAELMEGVLTMMLVTRWMFGAVVVAAIGIAAAGGAHAGRREIRTTRPRARSSASAGSPASTADAPRDQPRGDEDRLPTPPADRAARNVVSMDAAIELLMQEESRCARRKNGDP